MVSEIEFDKYKTKGAYHKEWYNDPKYAWYKACVDRIVKFCAGPTIDAGCGDGFVLDKIAENGHRVIGLDNEPSGLALCKQPTYLFDIEKDHLHANSYEYLCSLNTIEHLNSPTGLVELVGQVTKGAIIITDFPQETPSLFHIKEYSPDELAELFKDYETHSFAIDENFHGIEVYK